MNVQRFIDRRKELGLSQSELARGICTQTTISKFENQSQMMSTKILSRLCNRLGLTLNDLFSDQLPDEQQLKASLNQAEFDLITSEYDQALVKLDQLDLTHHQTGNLQMDYLFIKGFALALSRTNLTDAIFCFDQILNGLDETHQTIYSQLAYVGLGVAYEQTGNIQQADFYFGKMPERLMKVQGDSPDKTWKMITMLFYTGEFYAGQADYETSNALLNTVLTICSNQHMTFYVARAQYQLALNLVHTGAHRDTIEPVLAEAAVFARFNQNAKLLKKIAALTQQLDL
ncbi:helix-turn-helix domain-containing protein [Levilactobacillus bambusae]|uniref:XRE family transcriptional regulator n=1 Tax=Levilactobacillus bambusae TaxID=2024736 RepID=A0A2V1MZY0_9LACO|nr:helix-turn-helix transcriptional regulator [Levilactobacillus bambusae]PWG00372.1 XRE family transcriptional regulator [Levilactobacillus bambusae]